MLRSSNSLKTVVLRLQAPRTFSTYTELDEGKETLDKITSSNPKVLAYFTAAWCGPCKAIAPVFTTLAKDHGADVKFVKVDIDDNGTTSEQVGFFSRGVYPQFVSACPFYGTLHSDSPMAASFGCSHDCTIQMIRQWQQQSSNSTWRHYFFAHISTLFHNSLFEQNQAGISSVPTFKSFHNGKVTAQFTGANKDGLTKAVQALIALK